MCIRWVINFSDSIRWYLALWIVVFSDIQQPCASSAPVSSLQNAAKINGM